MQTIYKRFSVVAGFGLLLALLMGNAFVLHHELSVQLNEESLVVHSRQILYEAESTESLLKDAETGQRGFLYTGDPKYLAPYNLAAGQIEPHIDNLARLTSDDPLQQERVALLRDLARKKLGELGKTIDLYRSGNGDDARTIVMSNLGISYMDHIREVIARMEKEESTLEAERNGNYERSARITAWSIYVASALAALGLVLLAYFILREMALRERHAAELRAREEWFRVTLTSIGDAVIATDPQGKVNFLNPVAEALTGTSIAEAKGRDIRDVFPIFNEMTHEPAQDPVKKVMELGHTVGLANHTVLKHVNGTLIPIEDSAAPIHDDRQRLIGVVLVFHDATADRKAQEAMRKAEKLAAAGRLAASMAHEINNPLEAVVNLIYLAKSDPEVPAEIGEQLTLAEHELERVAHLTRQTLGFYRESNEPEPVEMQALIESVIQLYASRLGSRKIAVKRDYAKCPPIRGVPGELKQVMSNLLSNAADAVGVKGTIMVRLQCSADGGRVTVIVEDDGPGIAPEHTSRIFEPFFTTKKDVGTGLGLWVTREIVERHGGTVTAGARQVPSAERGAAFTIELPGMGHRADDGHIVS